LAGLGLLIATLTRNMAHAGMLLILALAPMVFLFRAGTPTEAMPTWMSTLIRCLPLQCFIDAGYGIVLKGNSVDLIGAIACGHPRAQLIAGWNYSKLP
jgi:ABC-2 type transport system permease protein